MSTVVPALIFPLHYVLTVVARSRRDVTAASPVAAMRGALRWLGAATLAMTACSLPDRQAVSTETAPVPSSSLVSSSPSSSTLANTPHQGSHGTSASATASESALSIDPNWVGSDPKLTRILASASPACAIKDLFQREPDGSVSHRYEVYAPALESSDLEVRFREGAKASGYVVTKLPAGLGFVDEPKQRYGMINDAFASLVLARVDGSTEAARALAANSGFECWSLVEALGGTWSSMSVQRGAGHAATLSVELPLPAVKRTAVETWTRDRAIAKEEGAWIRKHRKEPHAVAGIVIELKKDGVLSILETRGDALEGPSCVQHPSRLEAKRPDPSAPVRPASSMSKDEEDLMRKMMK